MSKTRLGRFVDGLVVLYFVLAGGFFLGIALSVTPPYDNQPLPIIERALYTLIGVVVWSAALLMVRRGLLRRQDQRITP